MANKEYSIVDNFIEKNLRSFKMAQNLRGWVVKGKNNL